MIRATTINAISLQIVIVANLLGFSPGKKANVDGDEHVSGAVKCVCVCECVWVRVSVGKCVWMCVHVYVRWQSYR